MKRGGKNSKIFNSINLILAVLLIVELIFIADQGSLTGNPIKQMTVKEALEASGTTTQKPTSPNSIQGVTFTAKNGEVYDLSKLTNGNTFTYSVDPNQETLYLSVVDKKTNQLKNTEIKLKTFDSYIVQLSDEPIVVHNKNQANKGALASSSTIQYKNSLTTKQINLEKEIKIVSKTAKIGNEYQTVFNGFKVEGVSPEEVEKIKKLSNVKRVYPNYKVYSTLMDATPLIGADSLWSQQIGGTPLTGIGVRVGVIDTGVDYTHPDLGGCFGSGCKVIGGYDFVNNDADPMDDMGHGTHVASTVAGEGVLNGVAPGATIYAYKVLDSGGSGSWDGVMAGIERSIDPNQDGDTSDHLDIISLSLGTNCGGYNENCGPDDAISQAIDNAVDAGVVAVIAAGNSGPGESTIGSPGTARKAITVGATYKKDYDGQYWSDSNPRVDQITSFSSRGPVTLGSGETVAKPDLVAPGAIICAARYDSIFPPGAHNYYYPCVDDKHVQMAGTSMATPIVSGAVALLKQRQPALTPSQIKDVLKTNAVDLGLDPNIQGAGRIDIFKAAGQDIPAIIDPFSKTIDFIPTQRNITKNESFQIKNLISGDLTFNLSIENNNTGITARVAQTNVNVPAGGSKEFGIVVTVDNNLLMSNKYYKFYVVAKSGDHTLKATVKVYVESRISSNISKIDLGIDLPNQVSWSKNFNLALTNLRGDSNQNYYAMIKVDKAKYYHLGYSGQIIWNEEERDISNYFTLSPDTLYFGAGETKTLSGSVSITNSQLANGIYSGEIILAHANGLDVVKIPITFAKYHEFILDLNTHNGTDDLPFAYLKNSNSRMDITSYVFGKTLPATIYVDEAGTYDLIMFGWKARPSVIEWWRDPIDSVKQVTINGLTSYTIDFSDVTNSFYFDPKDKDNKHFNWGAMEFLFSEDNNNTYWGTFYDGYNYNTLFNQTLIRKYSALPSNYGYSFIARDLCSPNTDIYSSSGEVWGPTSDYSYNNGPDNVIKVCYNSPTWKTIIPVHKHRMVSWTTWCYDENNVLPSGSCNNLYITSKDKHSWLLFNIEQFYNSEKNTSFNNNHEEGPQSPEFDVVNGKLRKYLFDNWFDGSLLEETSDKNLTIGLGPDFWFGRINAGRYSYYLQIMSKEMVLWNWYFLGQGFDQRTHEDMPYSLVYQNGSIIDSGLLYGGNLWSSQNYYWRELPFAGVYTFNLQRDYYIQNQRYLGIVKATFNPDKDDGKVPYLDSVKVLCDNKPCDFLQGSSKKITFVANPNQGILIQAKVFYLTVNNQWLELPVSLSNGVYEATITSLKNPASFRISLKDDSSNELQYEFSLPAKVYCTDSDGGKAYSVKGTVTVTNPPPSNITTTYNDTCTTSNNLKEYYCNANETASFENYYCTYGCSSGKCNPNQNPPGCYVDPKTKKKICKAV